MTEAEYFPAVVIHCLICGQPIPTDRPKIAVTCSPECTEARKQWRRRKQDFRECTYCRHPSSPAERSRYLRWRRAEEKNPPPDDQLSPEELAEREYRKTNPKRKRGRPKKTPALLEASADDKAVGQLGIASGHDEPENYVETPTHDD